MDDGFFKNGDRKFCVDNYVIDYNYVCSGFLMRKVGLNINRFKFINSFKEVLVLDLKYKSENFIFNGVEMSQFRKRGLSVCNKEFIDKERIFLKRYRGLYCEDSFKGNNSFDEDYYYNRSRSRFYSSFDEQSDYERSQYNRKYYSYLCSFDVDKNQQERSYRRYSLGLNGSFDERDCFSLDEDSMYERRYRYDLRGFEFDSYSSR